MYWFWLFLTVKNTVGAANFTVAGDKSTVIFKAVRSAQWGD